MAFGCYDMTTRVMQLDCRLSCANMGYPSLVENLGMLMNFKTCKIFRGRLHWQDQT